MTSTFTVSSMGDDKLVIDLRSAEPSYQQLARQLRDRIRDGRLPAPDAADGALPSLAYLVGETGLAVNTVRRALTLLTEEGYVVIVPGRGTYVADKLPE
jgi:GntR family transcriptional regulator